MVPGNSEYIQVQRNLTAIVAADIVGYSRLMSEDETRTLAVLTTLVLSRLRSGLSAHLGGLSFESQGTFATQR